MGRTPDPIGDSVEIPETGLDPVLVGEIRLNAGALKARDVIGTFNLRSGTGLTYIEYLLGNEPFAETGATDATYTPTYSGNLVTKEEWKRNDTTLIKSIDYTYTGLKVTSEVRKIFAADGTTIVAQVTWSYTYTGNKLTSASMVRDV